MHKPGESVTSWDFGSASEWLHLLVAMSPFIAMSVFLGVIVAIAFRRRRRFEVPITIAASVALYAFVAWLYYPNEWSWRQPIVSAMYQIAPVVWFFVGPALLGAAIVHWIRSRGHTTHLTNR